MLPLAMSGWKCPTGHGLIIAGVVVLLFGGSKIAGFGKSLGDGIKEFKKATDGRDRSRLPLRFTKNPISQTTVVGAGVKTEEK